MTARVLRPVITFTTVTAVLLAALAVYAFLSAGATRADSVYTPITTAKYCNAMPAAFPDAAIAGNPACSENLMTGAAADYYTELSMTGAELNFSAVVTFAPVGTTITDGNSLNEGAKIGGLSSTTTLGTANGACSSTVPVDFVFYVVDLPDNMGDPRASANIVFPRDEGSTDRFGGWAVGASPGGNGTGTAPGVAPRATGTSIAILNYPSHLLDLFDPDFVPGVGDNADGGANSLPIVPKAVYGGLTSVVGTWQMLYFAQFDPTGSRSVAGLPSPFTLMDSTSGLMGAPSVSVLNDTTAVQASPSSITDFCTPLGVKTTLLGAEVGGGATRTTNPAAGGTAFVMQYNASLRDTDQDGFENQLDSCQTAVDAGYNPHAGGAGGDSDSDGLANSCDPNDASNVLDANYADHDLDLFQNRQDNCGAVANNNQADSEISSAAPADDGPHTDGIGDVCDSEAGTIAVIQNRSSGAATVSITMSDTVANGRYHVITNNIPKCFGATAAGGTDVDGDGYCAAQDSGAESGTCAGTAPPSCAVRHNAPTGTSALNRSDTDADGFSDALETYMGTDATKSCAMTPVPPSIAGGVQDETLDNWPMDFTDNRLSDILDVSTFGARFNKPVNAPGAGTRHDLTANGLIDILDVSKFGTTFNKRCGGDVGQPGPFVQQ